MPARRGVAAARAGVALTPDRETSGVQADGGRGARTARGGGGAARAARAAGSGGSRWPSIGPRGTRATPDHAGLGRRAADCGAEGAGAADLAAHSLRPRIAPAHLPHLSMVASPARPLRADWPAPDAVAPAGERVPDPPGFVPAAAKEAVRGREGRGVAAGEKGLGLGADAPPPSSTHQAASAAASSSTSSPARKPTGPTPADKSAALMARATGAAKGAGFLCFMMWMSGAQVWERGGRGRSWWGERGAWGRRAARGARPPSTPPPLPLPPDPPVLHHDDRFRHLHPVDGHPEIGRRWERRGGGPAAAAPPTTLKPP